VKDSKIATQFKKTQTISKPLS